MSGSVSSGKKAQSAHAYTPGLRVSPLSRVWKIRRLPLPGEVLVNKDDKVSYDTIVARTNMPGDIRVVSAAAILGVEPEELPIYMKKKVGDPVKKDEIIAMYKAFFGLLKSEIKSPVDGYIEHISEVTGQVIIREPPIPVEVNAYIPGIVTEIIEKEGVRIDCAATFIEGIFGIGGERHGAVYVAVDSPDDELTVDMVSSKWKDKIVIGGSYASAEVMKKAMSVGAKGLVVGGMDFKDFSDFLGYEIGVAITGREDIPMTVIITEGFGKMRMAKKTFDLLKQNEGELACIDGATQIRAGVIRPEVIIPKLDVDPLSLPEEAEIYVGGMQPGTKVRVIRAPYFGALAKVVSLPVELQKVETESPVRVVEIELQDGKRVIVPRANVELFEW
ncbi:MAG: hypothetical protein DRJ30_06745 [Candidatus Methanomethylicota archaeon]|nr:MAG: hypothetical protein DRJ30_06745 [Candidatus Verstraetearchaeota archaeon]